MMSHTGISRVPSDLNPVVVCDVSQTETAVFGVPFITTEVL